MSISKGTSSTNMQQLRDLALNLRWSWNEPARNLFARINPELWESTRHNPVLFLSSLDENTVQRVDADAGLGQDIAAAVSDLDAYMRSRDTWFAKQGAPDDFLTAYFSAEFGLAECMPIYSGGLGVLAGDHLKSASDLGVPLIGVSLLYRHGYFRQQVDESGWQNESYDVNDFTNMPVVPATDDQGNQLSVTMQFPGRTVTARIWRSQVGRTPLVLLDTDTPENSDEDRLITDKLYGGDNETRIQQEIVLGIGGYRALETLGYNPSIYHMNEGHSAFLALERIRHSPQGGASNWEIAVNESSRGLIFTTHTPVEAGHDYFSPDLIRKYFSEYARDMGIGVEDILRLGRREQENPEDYLCMTVLALRTASHSNGVSKLHGEVSREMWSSLWKGRTVDEVPIEHITNGIHLPTWLGHDIQAACYDSSDPAGLRVDQRLRDSDLWSLRNGQRRELVKFARSRLLQQLQRHGVPEDAARQGSQVLDPDVLTIAFARRFATYKRATLLLSDPDRLARILNNPERPVQVIFAGKAHPKDVGGKQLIQRISQLSARERFQGKLLFFEDYDLDVARHLVQGADVWLNNPRRPLEASGTSGMKAAANGVLNLSTLDGWWAEAWDAAKERGERIGWSIGDGITYENAEHQAEVESRVLYELLENEVVSEFYARTPDGLPEAWIARIRASFNQIPGVFNTDRMVREYTERFYLSALGAVRA